MTDTHKVYFHKLGTKQSEDQLIIGGENFKRRYMTAGISDDERFLILDAAVNTSGNELYIKEVYFKEEMTSMIDKFFNSSAAQFASFFTSNTKMSQTELKELRDLIDKKIED
jgi:protease II